MVIDDEGCSAGLHLSCIPVLHVCLCNVSEVTLRCHYTLFVSIQKLFFYGAISYLGIYLIHLIA